jgi:Protein of unknown function (DUF3604)
MKMQDWIEQAYATGVPMGGDVRRSASKAPMLLIQAKEADGANLDRVGQVTHVARERGPSS